MKTSRSAISTEPVRVLHIFGAMDRGGAELRTLDLMRHIDRRQFEFEFCTLSDRPGALDDEIVSLGGAVHQCPLSPAFPFRFASLIRSRRVDVVHSHVLFASGAILAVAMLAGARRRIAHLRSTYDPNADTPGRQLYTTAMRSLIGRSATDILSCGTGVMTTLWSPAWSQDPRCAVIYNGIDPTAYTPPAQPAERAAVRGAVRAELGLPSHGPLLLQLGRFALPKHQRRSPGILAHIPDAALVYVGRLDRTEAQATQARVTELGLADRVHFAGERSDIPRLLQAADLLLLPSLFEGLPGVALEAAAAGTPVLSADLPGCREILAHLPAAGRVIGLDRPDEAWAAIAAELLSMGGDPAYRTRAHVAFLASPFTVSASAQRFEAVWGRAREK